VETITIRGSWLVCGFCIVVGFAVTGLGTAHGQQPSNFTGKVTRVEESSDGIISHFRFAAGARTKWHSHERGQIILCESGVCLTQVRGGASD
jgi:quercetin dioxygenase-like cupin family protein